jgi:hypothetical protein
VSDVDDAVEIDDIAEKRQKLIQSIEDGEIDNLKTSTVKKATRKKLDKLEDTIRLTDFLISKFSDLLGGLHAIEDSTELDNELKHDELLRRMY